MEFLNPLLYFASFAALFALFASVFSGTLWLLARLLRALVSPRRPQPRSSPEFHPHHLKRAGQ